MAATTKPTPVTDAYAYVQEGDLIQVEQGEQVIRGRVETGMNGLALLGHTVLYYSRLGYTLHIIEKAKLKLPPEPVMESIIKQTGTVPAYRTLRGWRYITHHNEVYSWEQLLESVTEFEVLYEGTDR